MDRTKTIIGWAVSALFLVSAVNGLSTSIPAALVILIASAVWVPPLREYLFSQTKISVHWGIKAVLSIVLLVVATNVGVNSQREAEWEKEASEAKEMAALQASLKEKKAKEFSANPEPVLAEVRSLVGAGEWKKAEAKAKLYLPTENVEMNALYKQASAEATKLETAERAEKAEQARIAAESAKREELIKKQFSQWDGSHMKLERFVKKEMNNPDSYEHVETRFSDKGDYLLVVTTFRGTNAFGGVVKNTMAAKVDLDGNILEIVR